MIDDPWSGAPAGPIIKKGSSREGRYLSFCFAPEQIGTRIHTIMTKCGPL